MPETQAQADLLRACRWNLRGQIQGVGFRPFVFRLAKRFCMAGSIWNNSQGVIIEAQGTPKAIEQFSNALHAELPLLAHIDACTMDYISPHPDWRDFRIVPSSPMAQSTAEPLTRARITVDTAVCADCLREMHDITDRRHGYGLINCTQCGPRYSIIREIPYDRPNTSMREFPLCGPCAAEYADPGNRRFHAQPTACVQCGPQVQLLLPDGRPTAHDPIAAAASVLAAGKIVAIKGIGGFHLAVRADLDSAVQKLRQAKHRDAKPFAVMCADIAAARQLVHLTTAGWQLLTDPAAPIVIGRQISGAAVAAGVAPGTGTLGVMLAYSPLHHLLFDALADFPVPHRYLVMTSGNVQDEPLVIDTADAVTRLGPMVDALLIHNRPIVRSVDDSVFVDMKSAPPLPVRRSRGYVPAPLHLPISANSPGLCMGAELKNTVALVNGGHLVLSQHLGDLTHPLARENFIRTIQDFEKLYSQSPRWIACDLHPMYVSSQYAAARGRRLGIPIIRVQHHHAHAAALLGEHRLATDILAIVCDGSGLGPEGQAWGGELLLAGPASFKRLGGLRPLPLAGGDRAARDIRRCALAALYQAMGTGAAADSSARALFESPGDLQMLMSMLERRIGIITSSSAGRYFDAIAALLGLTMENSFEAQAALSVQAAADVAAGCGSPMLTSAWALVDSPAETLIDMAPFWIGTIHAIRTGIPASNIARSFHEAMAQAWRALAVKQARIMGIQTVGLTGGVMANSLFADRLADLLAEEGLTVLRHRLAPAGDGGIAYGQGVVAAARMARHAPAGLGQKSIGNPGRSADRPNVRN